MFASKHFNAVHFSGGRLNVAKTMYRMPYFLFLAEVSAGGKGIFQYEIRFLDRNLTGI